MGTHSIKRSGNRFRIVMAAGIMLLAVAVLTGGIFFLKRPVVKTAHISVDDATMIFQDIYWNRYDSIFENPILGKLKELHDGYGMKVTLYVYYRLETFSLQNMPEDYYEEFEENADWLRIGFHSGTEELESEETIRDFMTAYANTQKEIKRFAGEAATTKILRLHDWKATDEMVDFLLSQGIKGLLCQDEKTISYDLTQEQVEELYATRDGILKTDDMIYYVTDIRLETTENINTVLKENRKDRVLVIFTHAWCFMDNSEKLEEAVRELSEAGYSFEWLEKEE